MLISVGTDADSLALDIGMEHLAAADLDLIGQLADEAGLTAMRALLGEGAVLNPTEERRVTHVRDRSSIGGDLARALSFADAVRNGSVSGSTGQSFETVVNLGIGGSDLGPRLVSRALGAGGGPAVRFVASVDPLDLDEALVDADPRTTLFVISSKTMTTTETLHNAARARRWLEAVVGDGAADHFAAASADPVAATEWGVHPDRVFVYDRGIGGRFSVSSAAGLAAAIACGSARYGEFLAGMTEMDRHFLGSAPRSNLPLVHGVLAVLNSLVHGCSSWAVVPYSTRLSLLVPYLQQLTMESNGKSVGLDGRPVPASAPALWGSVGTEGQHAYFQWLHQGTEPTAVDFVVVGSGAEHDDEIDVIDEIEDRHGQRHGNPALRRQARELLVAHALAQAEALAFGHSAEELRTEGCDERLVPHRVFIGNRQSCKVLLRRVSPRSLGLMLAMYEHSTVVQGWLWGVNSFDQFGVERGKQLAAMIAGPGSGPPAAPGSAVAADSPERSSILRWLRA